VLTTLRFGIIGRGSLSPRPSSRPLPGSVVTLDLRTRDVTQALEKVRWTLCAGRGYTLTRTLNPAPWPPPPPAVAGGLPELG
jgi:hypothetical protein